MNLFCEKLENEIKTKFTLEQFYSVIFILLISSNKYWHSTVCFVGRNCGHRSTLAHSIFELSMRDSASSFFRYVLNGIAQFRMKHKDLMPVTAPFASRFPIKETNKDDVTDKQIIAGATVARFQCYLLVIAMCHVPRVDDILDRYIGNIIV